MNRWKIESKAGADFGVWPGETAEQAFAAMVAAGGSSGGAEGTAADWIIKPAPVAVDALTWYAGRTPKSTHKVTDGTAAAFAEAPGLTLQQVADAYLLGYTLPPDDDGSPIAFSVEQLDAPPAWKFTGLPDQPATPAPRRGRPPVSPQMTRVQVAIRLPKWIVDWMDEQPDADRTSLIEEAMLKRYKLKAPKS